MPNKVSLQIFVDKISGFCINVYCGQGKKSEHWPKKKRGGKGQLISKCPFGFIVWTKLPTKLFLNFCPEIFCTFLGASWKLFGASCRLPCLWYYILSPQEAQRASMKPPGSYKKTQGRNPEIISLVFLSKRWNQKDILKLTDLWVQIKISAM